MSKKNFGWLFTCIVLAVLLVISIVLGVTGYFSSVAYLRSNSDLTVGDTVVIGVNPNEASVVSFTFDGAYLPNERLPQVVQITGQVLSSSVRVRVKAQVFGSDNAEFGFVTTDHFEKDADGYYYFDDVLMGGNKITFCSHLITPEDGDFVSGEKYILSIIVETVDVQNEGVWTRFAGE